MPMSSRQHRVSAVWAWLPGLHVSLLTAQLSTGQRPGAPHTDPALCGEVEPASLLPATDQAGAQHPDGQPRRARHACGLAPAPLTRAKDVNALSAERQSHEAPGLRPCGARKPLSLHQHIEKG